MRSAGDILPYLSLLVLVGGLAAALLLRPIAVWAIPASFAIFTVGIWLPATGDLGSDTPRLHYFPVTLALLVMTIAGVPVSALFGYVGRTLWRWRRGAQPLPRS